MHHGPAGARHTCPAPNAPPLTSSLCLHGAAAWGCHCDPVNKHPMSCVGVEVRVPSRVDGRASAARWKAFLLAHTDMQVSQTGFWMGMT